MELGNGYSKFRGACYHACHQSRKIQNDVAILVEKEALGILSKWEMGKFELLLGRPPNMNIEKKSIDKAINLNALRHRKGGKMGNRRKNALEELERQMKITLQRYKSI